MDINHEMSELLNEIKTIEPRRKVRRLNVPVDEIGDQLIDYYYHTTSLETRSLIGQFMEHAGFLWVKKLIIRDTGSGDRVAGFSTLDEYAALAATNDPQGQWFHRA